MEMPHISARRRGRGIAIWALTSLNDSILSPGLFRKLQAGLASTNPGPVRVLEKSGICRGAVFSKEFFDGPTLHDSFVYKEFRPSADFTEAENIGSMEIDDAYGTR